MQWYFHIRLIYAWYFYIYMYAFSRCFYPKRLTVHSGYSFLCQYIIVQQGASEITMVHVQIIKLLWHMCVYHNNHFWLLKTSSKNIIMKHQYHNGKCLKSMVTQWYCKYETLNYCSTTHTHIKTCLHTPTHTHIYIRNMLILYILWYYHSIFPNLTQFVTKN